MKIIYIRKDYRKAVKNNQGEWDQNTITEPNQVYSKTNKHYKIGDYMSLKLQIRPYAVYKSKILYLEEVVLAKVVNIIKNILVVDLLQSDNLVEK